MEEESIKENDELESNGIREADGGEGFWKKASAVISAVEVT